MTPATPTVPTDPRPDVPRPAAVPPGGTPATVAPAARGTSALPAGGPRIDGKPVPLALPPASGPRLILARHGRTRSNVSRTLDSRPPGAPLDAVGLAQAIALGERLATEPVSAVHASTAIRAQQTAAPVARAHGLDVGVVDGVHEVFCGDLEGRSDPAARTLFDETYAAWWSGDLHARLPGGESAHDLRARFLPVLDQLMAGAGATVVLVSHGAAIRLVGSALLGDDAETRYVPNTGLVVVRPAGSGWVVEHWDPVPGDVAAGGRAAAR